MLSLKQEVIVIYYTGWAGVEFFPPIKTKMQIWPKKAMVVGIPMAKMFCYLIKLCQEKVNTMTITSDLLSP